MSIANELDRYINSKSKGESHFFFPPLEDFSLDFGHEVLTG